MPATKAEQTIAQLASASRALEKAKVAAQAAERDVRKVKADREAFEVRVDGPERIAACEVQGRQEGVCFGQPDKARRWHPALPPHILDAGERSVGPRRDDPRCILVRQPPHYAGAFGAALVTRQKNENEAERMKAQLPGLRLALVNETAVGDLWATTLVLVRLL